MELHQPVEIFLVEDDDGHALLIEKNLRRAGVTNRIVRFVNGQQVLDRLLAAPHAAGDSAGVSPLVLLDLNLPVVDGYQVLRRLKEDPLTRRIPVVVLTTTEDPREIDRCYDLGCNVYLSKPVEYDRFCEAIRNLGLFLSVVSVPAAA